MSHSLLQWFLLSSLLWSLLCFVKHTCHSHAGKHVNGSNSIFWAARLLFSRLWKSFVFCLWVPYNCSKVGIQAGMKLFAATAAAFLVFAIFSTAFGAVLGLATVVGAMLSVSCIMIMMQGKFVRAGLCLQPQNSTIKSGQPGQQTAQSQSPVISGTQLHQQTVSSRQPQAHVTPTLDSPAPAVHQPFTIPDSADHPLISAFASSGREYIQQQIAILAAIQRQRWSHPGPIPHSVREADGSAAGPSYSAAASAVPLSMPVAGKSSTSRSRTATESKSQLADVCVVCMDASKDWLCMPCRHLAMCGACTARIQHQTGRCPICQQYIRQAVQVYKA